MLNTAETSKRAYTESSISSADSSTARKKVKMETKLALGAYSFKELVKKSSIFIDKSLLIKQFLNHPAKALLITCPRRWGKSTNMSMIKTFFEIEVDEKGNKYLDKTTTSNYKLFHVPENEKKKLKIAQHLELMNEYQGEYPVISIDFYNVKGFDYKQIVDGFKYEIYEAFKQHDYIVNHLNATLKDKKSDYSKKSNAKDNLDKFLRVLNSYGKDMEELHIKNSLNFLSKLLYTHFGKKVYILMDNYDTPISSILKSEKLFSKQDLNKTIILFQGIMGATFKRNENLEKGLITGVFRIAKSSDYNNVVEYNFLNNEFAQYFGFTQEDIKYLFDECEISEEDQRKAESWYDGYRFTSDPNLKIYNPWSTLNFLNSKKIANYWEESSIMDSMRKVFKIDEIKERTLSLLDQKDIAVRLDDLKFSQENFVSLQNLRIAAVTEKYNYYAGDLFFAYLFAAGYLTIATCDDQITRFLTSVKIPNEEIKNEFERKLNKSC